MKIYIMTDQEGVAGVVNADDYGGPSGRYYERAKELTTLEVNAAIEGAVEAGATEFLVFDCHGQGSIDQLLLDPRAELHIGHPRLMPMERDGSFDAQFIVGQHAKANTDGGHLCHSFSFAIEGMTINGTSVGEMACDMLGAAYFGIPTILVTGDAAACAEAHELVPKIETAAVKRGITRGSASGLTPEQNKLFNGAAVHKSPQQARRLIKEAAIRAVQRINEIKPFWIEPPYELVRLKRAETAGDPPSREVFHSDDMIELLAMRGGSQPLKRQAG